MQKLSILFLKIVIQFIAWVFVLSLEWNGVSLYQRARMLLVENAYVSALKGQAKVVSEQASSRISVLLQQSKTTLGSEKKFQ